MDNIIINELGKRLFYDTYVMCEYVDENSESKKFISILRGIVKLSNDRKSYIFDNKKYDLNGDEIYIDIKQYPINSVIPILYETQDMFGGVYLNSEFKNPIFEYAKENICEYGWIPTELDFAIKNEKLDSYIYLDEENNIIYSESLSEYNKKLDLSEYYNKYHIATDDNYFYVSVNSLDFDPYRFKNTY